MVKPLDHVALSGCLSFPLSHLRSQPRSVEPCQNLALLDAVAFLDEHAGDALAIVEGQLDLSQIHISVQHQLAGRCRAMSAPPNDPDDQTSGRKGQDDDDVSSHTNKL